MFAKLYDTEYGQILVKQDEGDNGPEIRFFFKPDGMGVCSFALEFSNDDTGWDDQETAFNKIDEDYTTTTVSSIISKFGL